MQRQLKFRYWNVQDNRFYEQPEIGWSSFPSKIREEDAWCQFTGLLDAKGVKIYEGDITNALDWDDKPREVVFWEGCFCHKREDGNGHIFNPKKVEVIGNIFENPELLAAKERI